MNDTIPSVSVIIPTYNRAGLLARCLKSVFNLDYPPQKMQLIVVDDGSDDSTAEVVHALNNSMSRITFIKHRRNQGVSAARNTGMNEARGFYWIFLDDDCEVPREWVAGIRETFRRYPAAAAVGGSIVSTASSPLGQAAYLVEFSSWLPAGKIRWINNIPACNSGYRADAVRGQRFTEGLQPFEDSLFNYRLIKAGKRIIFNPRVFIFHHKGQGMTSEQFRKSQERYALAFLRGGYQVFGKKGELLRAFPWLNLLCLRMPFICFRCARFGFLKMFRRRLFLIFRAEWIRGRTIYVLPRGGHAMPRDEGCSP
jgi:glycosyltransferase involved in cell wall biosynthesis